MKKLTIVHRSGTTLELDVEDAEFFVVPPEDEEGNPNENPGNLTGYRIDTGDRVPVFYARVSEIDVVMVEEKPQRRARAQTTQAVTKKR